MAFFSEGGIPTAHPILDNEGKYIRSIKNKPTALVKRLNGASIDVPNAKQCKEIGFQMAKMHTLGKKFKFSQESSRDESWRSETIELVMPKLSNYDQDLLNNEIEH